MEKRKTNENGVYRKETEIPIHFHLFAISPCALSDSSIHWYETVFMFGELESNQHQLS